MLHKPAAKAITKLTARGTAPTAAIFTAACLPSRIAAPPITGIARSKLHSAAATGSSPVHNPTHTVEPDREMPRTSAATPCAAPTPAAAAHPGPRLALATARVR